MNVQTRHLSTQIQVRYCCLSHQRFWWGRSWVESERWFKLTQLTAQQISVLRIRAAHNSNKESLRGKNNPLFVFLRTVFNLSILRVEKLKVFTSQISSNFYFVQDKNKSGCSYYFIVIAYMVQTWQLLI